MIDLGSIAGLHAHDHELHCYCARCDRWVVLDLAAMIRDGQGERRLPITVRCQVCGTPGKLQVRPPVPTLENYQAAPRTPATRCFWNSDKQPWCQVVQRASRGIGAEFIRGLADTVPHAR